MIVFPGKNFLQRSAEKCKEIQRNSGKCRKMQGNAGNVGRNGRQLAGLGRSELVEIVEALKFSSSSFQDWSRLPERPRGEIKNWVKVVTSQFDWFYLSVNISGNMEFIKTARRGRNQLIEVSLSADDIFDRFLGSTWSGNRTWGAATRRFAVRNFAPFNLLGCR